MANMKYEDKVNNACVNIQNIYDEAIVAARGVDPENIALTDYYTKIEDQLESTICDYEVNRLNYKKHADFNTNIDILAMFYYLSMSMLFDSLDKYKVA